MAEPIPQKQELPDPRIDAGQARQALHILIAGAGWVLFFYWWSIVLRRVSSQEVRFTALFIGISLVVVVAITLAWVIHNLSLFRRRGPRTNVRRVDQDVRQDHLGRALQFEAGHESIRTAPTVRVIVDGGRKLYKPSNSAA